MDIAVITDIHFGVKNNSSFFLSQYENFFNDVFFPTIKQRQIKTVLILGDTWEDRKTISPHTLKKAREIFFDRLKKENIQVKIIYGNHDIFYKDTNETNSIDFLGEIYDNIEVVKKYKVFKFGDLKIGMISWIHRNNLDESLAWMGSVDCDWLCGHFEIKNFKMTKDNICQHGFEKNIFDRFERVLTGHFHTITDDGKIFYISNPFQTSWADYKAEKGFRIIDTNTRQIEFVQNPYDVYERVFFDKKIDVMVHDYEQYKDKIVKVHFKNFSAEKEKLNLFIENVSKFCHEISIEELDDVFNREVESIEEIDAKDTTELIRQYIDEVVNSETVDKNVLFDKIVSLYDKALGSDVE